MTLEQIEIARLRGELAATLARAENAERELERTRIDLASRRDEVGMLRTQLAAEVSHHFDTHVSLTNANDRVAVMVGHEGDYEQRIAELVVARDEACLWIEEESREEFPHDMHAAHMLDVERWRAAGRSTT